MAQAKPFALSAFLATVRAKAALTSCCVLLALLILLVFIGQQARSLWGEWHRLQSELTQVRQTTVIGYSNISPRISYAKRPENWLHHEGDFTFLWGGWDSRAGHRWFRIDRGDLEQGAISLPIGRDVFQAIDVPLVESEGGPIWGRIPSDSLVFGLETAGVASVYPVLVLEKVQVVNDVIERRPILLIYNPYLPPHGVARAYDAMLDGRRVTMGTSGYYHGADTLFYDRGSESLWREEPDALRAIAGPRKGRTLRQVAHLVPIAWGDWRWRNPRGRLLVGADRSRGEAGTWQTQ